MTTIQKYKDRTTAQLKNAAIRFFNAFIRHRDAGQPCISCGQMKTLQAGHFYPAGRHNNLRFNEDNVHGQCLQCNYYNSANLHPYRHNLIKKIGIERVEALDQMSLIKTTRDDRLALIEIIETYKEKGNKLKRKNSYKEKTKRPPKK